MVLVSTSCVDAVILTEMVISGSRLTTNFDKIFHHILIGLIFFRLFCFMVLFQDNPKLVEARFV